MNREIKFRAWTDGIKKMIYGPPLVYNFESGEYEAWLDRPTLEPGHIYSTYLMQYTGLEDKNGVEIYEGDIIAWYLDHDYGSVVEWEQETCRFCLPGCMTSFLCHVLRPNRLGAVVGNKITEYEVIGNIYENPELMEKNTNVD